MIVDASRPGRRFFSLPSSPLQRWAEPWRTRMRAWWAQRLPQDDTLQLTQRNIYIVPTRAGLMFAITLLVLLVASINYQLNLGYLLTFLLAGSGAVSMHITHSTLRGLRLHLRPPAPAFAGTPVGLEIVLTAPQRGPQTRHGIGLRIEAGTRDSFSWVDVSAGGQTTTRVSFVETRRGRQPMPMLRVETRFPLGLFRAWSLWRPAAQALIWPAPESPAAPLPALQAVGTGGHQVPARRTEGGDTEGVRAYRRGDSMRLVVWKKVARAGEMVTRDTGATVRQQLWLDEQTAGIAGREARLARLAAWVLEAERRGADYGLRLPGRELAPSQGDLHRLACLEALALCP